MATSEKEHSDGSHTQMVAKHYNELQESGLETRKQSRIFYLRNFNNWIKSVLIGETLQRLHQDNRRGEITVLDLCCGKGGDLLKWKKGNIDKLICVDIAETSVEQCEARYRDMRQRGGPRRGNYQEKMFNAEFLVADCTKARLKEMYKDPNTKFDIVSCQFSFHYSFESYPQAMTMIRNAAECLKPGGYFIGTTPDAYELVRRLQESSDNSFSNDVYRVTFHEKDQTNMPLFGARYNFHLEDVVDCPEFLVYFPLFEKLAKECGLKLIKKTRFDDFFRENCEKKEYRNLLNRMQALETYPAGQGKELVGHPAEDYEHARKFTESSLEGSHDSSRRPNAIGTLSMAEWEATTIYLVYIFQKEEQ